MKIELLYFDGCPGYEALLPALRELLAGEGIEDEIELRRIEDSAGALDQGGVGGEPVSLVVVSPYRSPGVPGDLEDDRRDGEAD